MIIAVGAFVLFFRRGIDGGVDKDHPPSIFAVNISFCAIIMGVLAVYRIRRLDRQALVRAGALAAIVLGMAGPFVFFWQGMHWRHSMEYGELARVGRIADAAREYAVAHNGKFPPGLAPLLLAGESDSWRLTPEDLRSPFRKTPPLTDVSALKKLGAAAAEKAVLEHSDFVYLGADLPGDEKFAGQKDANPIIVVTSKKETGEPFDRRLGDNIPVGFGSGYPRYILDRDMAKTLEESNQARVLRGLPAMDDRGRPGRLAPPK